MRCSVCSSTRLRNDASITSIHPDGRRRFTSQWWRCADCDATYYAVLTQWTEDGWVEHVGYHVPAKRYRRTVRHAQECPDPADVGCLCVAHAMYGTRWFGGTHSEAWRASQRVWDRPAELG